MENVDFLTALCIAHIVGMMLTALWFYPTYFKSHNCCKCIEKALFAGLVLLGWIPLICLFVDLNKNRD